MTNESCNGCDAYGTVDQFGYCAMCAAEQVRELAYERLCEDAE